MKKTLCTLLLAATLGVAASATAPTADALRPPVERAPMGHLDEAYQTPGGVFVRGWAADPDFSWSSVAIMVYSDGTPIAADMTRFPRSDVPNVYPALGPNQGFEIYTTPPLGVHNISAVAKNLNTGGADTTLGCISVNVQGNNPFGTLDVATETGSLLRLQGWGIDSNITTPISIKATVDGNTATIALNSTPSTMASTQITMIVRGDVGRVFPGYGANHGFDVVLRSDTFGWGPHNVCVTLINVGLGANTMKCATVNAGVVNW